MENRLLDQYNSVIVSQWKSQEINENYAPLNHRELFELAYHTCNTMNIRCISIMSSQDTNKGGSRAVLYSNNKTFICIESFNDFLKITKYFNEGNGERLIKEIQPTLKKRREKFHAKDKEIKVQILKTILVERKLDECANLVMLKDLNRKVYFAIGDARESAAVVPMFMNAEGASLVQLALNKWMSTTQRLVQEHNFPESHAGGLLKNIMQIKKWVLNLISVNLDKT